MGKAVNPRIIRSVVTLAIFALFAGCSGGGDVGGGTETSDSAKFSVTYVGNGNTSGNVPVDTTSYEQGGVVMVIDNIGSLIKTGYTFIGWSMQANGIGTSYAPGQIFTMGASSVTLYAKWTASEDDIPANYELTVNISGSGTVAPSERSFPEGSEIQLTANPAEGWKFDYWNGDISGNANPHILRIDKNITVNAVFTRTTTAYLIIDHKTLRLASISEYWINQAKTKFHIGYQHTSHGSQIVDGMTGLAAWKGSLYAFNNGGSNGALDLRDYDLYTYAYSSGTVQAEDLGNPNWVQNTRNYLNAKPQINVIMWSWCGQVSGASEAGINDYLNLMNQLEQEFPNVKFVYMTGHVDGGRITDNCYLRNEQIRKYCRDNNKILFDFADIESWDPDGVSYVNKLVLDSCYYDANNNGNPWDDTANWAIDWQNSHVLGVDWYNCGSAHSQPLNANLKAYAAWWMFARMAGWDGL